MSEAPLRWGLIGAGDVCERKGGPPLYQVPGHRLVACTRRDAEKGADYARRHGPCRYVPTVDELLAMPEIDAVYVATPPGVHCVQTLAAARAGKHVLVEKPMALHAGECAEMITACRAAGVTLAVAYYRRGYPSILRAAELLRLGEIGTLRDIEINDEFPPSHRLDLVHFFAGDLASVRTEAVDGPAGARLFAETLSGVRLRMNLGWRESPKPFEQIRLTGDGGEIFIDDLKGGSLEVRHSGGIRRETFPPLPWTHWGLVENFGQALRGEARLACDGAEGRKSSVVLDVVSLLRPGEPAVRVDYNHPPSPDALRASGLNLLG
jgi:predicted dehydrogenase